MRKSKLTDGTPFIGVKIEHFVTSVTFATALADYCWTKSIDFNPKMKKSEAMRILKRGLFFGGKRGETYDGQFDGASEEVFNAWNTPYEQALEWVHKNYPYLTNPTK